MLSFLKNTFVLKTTMACPTASKWQSQDSSPGLCRPPGLALLPTPLYSLSSRPKPAGRPVRERCWHTGWVSREGFPKEGVPQPGDMKHLT